MTRFAIILITLTFALLACGSGTTSDVKKDSALNTVIYFTRHAEKASGDDPALLPAGERRATRIARQLPTEEITAVYATGYRRTQSTAIPTAKAAGVEIQTYSGGDSAKSLTAGWLAKHKGETILVVGHSNTVPDLVNALVPDASYSNIDENTYSRLFKVTVDKSGKPRVKEMNSGR